MVPERAYPVPSGRTALRSASDMVDLTTPPGPTEPAAADSPELAKIRANARRNLTRNANRKAAATFAKEMKDSLASGRPTAIAAAVEQTDMKSAWHTAAKEVAYKFLDLRKESWKDYSSFDKAKVHKELAAQYKFDPPIDPMRIDKYLSGHLRTSRAVWKGHWKKYGPEKRHNNCPEEAWEKLTAWWPTGRCQEEAAKMASRRARVENPSKVGRSSLLDRMDVQVSNMLLSCDMDSEIWMCVVGIVCMQGSRRTSTSGIGTPQTHLQRACKHSSSCDQQGRCAPAGRNPYTQIRIMDSDTSKAAMHALRDPLEHTKYFCKFSCWLCWRLRTHALICRQVHRAVAQTCMYVPIVQQIYALLLAGCREGTFIVRR